MVMRARSLALICLGLTSVAVGQPEVTPQVTYVAVHEDRYEVNGTQAQTPEGLVSILRRIGPHYVVLIPTPSLNISVSIVRELGMTESELRTRYGGSAGARRQTDVRLKAQYDQIMEQVTEMRRRADEALRNAGIEVVSKIGFVGNEQDK